MTSRGRGPAAPEDGDPTVDARTWVESPANDSTSEPFDSLLEELGEIPAIDPAAQGLRRFAPGDSIGRFEVVGTLGRGGFGVVYEARDTTLDRLVAVKVLAGGDLPLPPQVDLFRREAKTAASLNHPSIVTLHDFGEWRGLPYLVLERLEGENIQQKLRRGPLPINQSVAIAVEVSRALIYAHRRGIIHRDIKPANVFLTEDGRVKVLDFGIARLLGALQQAPDDKSPLRRSTLIGTRAYMAPELWKGMTPDARADVYGTGVMLYEMLTGALPYPAAKHRTGLAAEATEGPDPLVELQTRVPELSAELTAVVARALARDPLERFANASDLCNALLELQTASVDLTATPHNPYRFLEPFVEADEGGFFGRALELVRLEQMLAQHPVVAVGGASGVGKTSLVQAGLTPRLQREGWTVLNIGTSGDLFLNLRRRLGEWSTDAGLRAEALPGEPRSLGDILRDQTRTAGSVVLVFDGLERLCARDATAAKLEDFSEAICSVAAVADPEVRVVLVLRDGCLDRLALAPDLQDLVVSSLLLVGAPSPEQLLEAARGPARQLGFEVDPLLCEELVRVLAPEPAPFPLMQLVLGQLWERRHRAGRRLTKAGLDVIGGVPGVLGRHANDVVHRLPTPEASATARRILCNLVDASGEPRPVTTVELLARQPDQRSAARVIEHLVDGRLLTAIKSDTGEQLVLAGGDMLRGWDLLAQWLDSENEQRRHRTRLTQSTALWRSSGRPRDLLWRGSRLQEELRFRKETGELIPREEREFLDASREHRRRSRLRRSTIAALLLLFVGAGVVGGLAYYQRQLERAKTDSPAAREARRVRASAIVRAASAEKDPAVAALLMAELAGQEKPPGALPAAVSLAETMIPLAVLHANGTGAPLSGIAVGPSADSVVTAAKDGSVLVWRSDGRGSPRRYRHRAMVLAVATDPRGRWLATGGDDRTIRIWREHRSGAPRILRGHQQPVHSLAFSADGKRILSASDDGTARVWPVSGDGPPLVLRHDGPVTDARFHADQARVFTASGDTLSMWGIRGGKWLASWRLGGRIRTIAASPDGAHVAAGLGDGALVLVRPDQAGKLHTLTGHVGAVRAVAFGPDGLRVTSGGDDRSVRVWTLADGKTLVLREHQGPVLSVAFGPRGIRVLSGSADGTGRLWWTRHPRRVAALRGHGAEVFAVRFLPGKEQVMTASRDGTARIWSARGPRHPLVLWPKGAPVRHGGWIDEGAVWTARFSPEGRLVVAAGGGGVARVWRSDGRGRPVVLRGHEEAVRDAAFSPDGRSVVTASNDDTARIWSTDGRGKPLVLRGHTQRLVSASFSPDGRFVVTAAEDRTARVWRADGTGKPLVLRGHSAPLVMARFSPDGRHVLTASADGTARVWPSDAGASEVVLAGHKSGVSAAGFSPNGGLVVTASGDATVRIWRADGTGTARVLRGHAAPVRRARFDPSGQRVVSASEDGTARVWRVDGREAPVVLRVLGGVVVDAAFSPDGARVATASSDGTIKVWRPDGQGKPLVLRGHTGWLLGVRFGPGGRRILSASGDGTARLWRANGAGKPIVFRAGHQVRGGTYAVLEVAFTPDGAHLATAAHDNTARLWDLTQPSPAARVLAGHEALVTSIRFSLDGTLLATSSYDRTARIWLVGNTTAPRVLRGHGNWVGYVDLHPRSTHALTASNDQTVRLWPLDAPGEPRVLRGHSGAVIAARFSTDGRLVVSSSLDGTARVWRTNEATDPVVLRGHRGWVLSSAFSPDGRRVVTASFDLTARLWDTRTGKLLRVLRGHTDRLISVFFSPDGRTILTASMDGTARVWDARGDRPPVVLRGHTRGLFQARYSPDGRWVGTASGDGTARVWRPDGLGEPIVLRGNGWPATCPAFSRDGKRVAVAFGDGSARVWDLDWSHLVERFRQSTTACLTTQQRVSALAEPHTKARAAYEACERRHGRTPAPGM